jgi:hypothetical protein
MNMNTNTHLPNYGLHCELSFIKMCSKLNSVTRPAENSSFMCIRHSGVYVPMSTAHAFLRKCARNAPGGQHRLASSCSFDNDVFNSPSPSYCATRVAVAAGIVNDGGSKRGGGNLARSMCTPTAVNDGATSRRAFDDDELNIPLN